MISWINYEKETRLEHMAELMEHVRLPLLPRDYLVQVSAGGGADQACPHSPRPLGTFVGSPGCMESLRSFMGLLYGLRTPGHWVKWEAC